MTHITSIDQTNVDEMWNLEWQLTFWSSDIKDLKESQLQPSTLSHQWLAVQHPQCSARPHNGNVLPSEHFGCQYFPIFWSLATLVSNVLGSGQCFAGQHFAKLHKAYGGRWALWLAMFWICIRYQLRCFEFTADISWYVLYSQQTRFNLSADMADDVRTLYVVQYMKLSSHKDLMQNETTCPKELFGWYREWNIIKFSAKK